MSRKLVIDDGRAERELLLVGTMVVGRDPECEISSGDPRLSRRHAELRTTPTGVVLRDLGSRNGVRVNGRPITEITLQAGDVVSIAHLSLRLVDDAVATPPAPRPMATAPVVLAGPVEDDRTRALPRGALAQTAVHVAAPVAEPVREPGDDRTRVLPQESRGHAGRAAAPAVPTDVGEFVLRDAPGEPRAGDGAAAADVGLQSLLGVGWGRRAVLQGVLLALVVFLMTLIPLVAWQMRVFRASPLSAWTVLLPPLAASVFAGAVVAALIARTTIRGVRGESRR